MHKPWIFGAATAVLLGVPVDLHAADWPRFRGVDGAGVAADAAAAPIQWGDAENLRWSVDLPGQGVSSPVVVGDCVYVTSWSGSGPSDLVRHLTCYERQTGRQRWSVDVAAAAPDENHDGMLTQTGYAAHTPACDGERIYCFFGVSGVYAFDLEGRQLWHVGVGTGFDPRHWGTAASPVLYQDLVIVNAASESKSIVALDKLTGAERWRYADPGLESTWGTPTLIETAAGATEMALAVPGFVWGFDPATGERLWHCGGTDPNSAVASVFAADGVAYAIVGRRGGSALAIRTGGRGDVSQTHVVWAKNIAGSIGTPLIHDGLIYNFAGGMAECIDAQTGERLTRKRLGAAPAAVRDAAVEPAAAQQPVDPPAADAATPPRDEERPRGERRGFGPPDAGQGFGPPGEGGPGRRGFGGREGRFGGGGGGGGGFRAQDYASPVVAGGHVYFTRRSGEVVVFALGQELEQVASNKFSGEADYSATPAIVDGAIYLRSSKKLYCIAQNTP